MRKVGRRCFGSDNLVVSEKKGFARTERNEEKISKHFFSSNEHFSCNAEDREEGIMYIEMTRSKILVFYEKKIRTLAVC